MSDELDAVLKHYGVKGMRWGQRHSKTRDYNAKDFRRDTEMYGSRGTSRIQSHIQGGKTIKQARRKEFRRQTAQGAAFIATAGAVLLGPGLAKTGAASLVNKRQAAAASKAAVEELITKYGVTAYKTIVL